MQCSKCGYVRQPGDSAPAYECPKCAMLYPVAPPMLVRVMDVDMTFGSMVGFMVKWALASIPAFIILFVLAVAAAMVFGGIFGR